MGSRDPAYLSAPSVTLRLLGLILLRRRTLAATQAGQLVFDRSQACFFAPGGDFRSVFQRMEFSAARLDVYLRAEALTLTLEDSDAVIDVGVLPSWQAFEMARLFKQCSALAHEVGFPDRVLCNQPRGLRSLWPDKFFMWPPMRLNDCAQRACILPVHFFHLRVIALGKQTSGFEFRSNF